MDELSEKLSALLNDPESMNRVREMAESILGGENAAQEENNPVDKSEVENLLDGVDIGNIINIISKFNSSSNDDNIKLIEALRPHLSSRRQERADSAVKILRLLQILPLIKESGIL